MLKVCMYTDGACKGNPGRGGWGTIIKIFYPDEETPVVTELAGSSNLATNNQMEMTAVLRGFQYLYILFPQEELSIDIYSDSSYVVKAFKDRWIYHWKKLGWKRPGENELANADIWQDLYALNQIHPARFHWVKGHNGHPENERCDELASTSAFGKHWRRNRYGLLELDES